MHDDVEKVLIDEDVIEKRLDVLAEHILEEFCGRKFVVVVILKGALVFTADLLRRMPIPLEIECINVASYHGATESSGQVDFLDAKLPPVGGRSVLLIDDILDTGRTLAAVAQKLREQGAGMVKSCVLLCKDEERAAEVEADHVGFHIGDEFVVGYGLDFRGLYRNLPFVGVLKEKIIGDPP
ncbi:MAG: hypoxanthine phosphoribosyltransferase [Roseibacillus sp.]|nr:hypoxanthine phosphoribosyltransferase [Roseibacillus sp.]